MKLNLNLKQLNAKLAEVDNATKRSFIGTDRVSRPPIATKGRLDSSG